MENQKLVLLFQPGTPHSPQSICGFELDGKQYPYDHPRRALVVCSIVLLMVLLRKRTIYTGDDLVSIGPKDPGYANLWHPLIERAAKLRTNGAKELNGAFPQRDGYEYDTPVTTNIGTARLADNWRHIQLYHRSGDDPTGYLTPREQHAFLLHAIRYCAKHVKNTHHRNVLDCLKQMGVRTLTGNITMAQEARLDLYLSISRSHDVDVITNGLRQYEVNEKPEQKAKHEFRRAFHSMQIALGASMETDAGLGSQEAVEQATEEKLAAQERLPENEVAMYARKVLGLSMCLVAAGEFAKAMKEITELKANYSLEAENEVARCDHRFLQVLPEIEVLQAHLALYAGDWTAALSHANKAIEKFVDYDDPDTWAAMLANGAHLHPLSSAYTIVGRVLGMRDNLEAAEQAFRNACATAHGHHQSLAYAHSMAADVLGMQVNRMGVYRHWMREGNAYLSRCPYWSYRGAVGTQVEDLLHLRDRVDHSPGNLDASALDANGDPHAVANIDRLLSENKHRGHAGVGRLVSMAARVELVAGSMHPARREVLWKRGLKRVEQAVESIRHSISLGNDEVIWLPNLLNVGGQIASELATIEQTTNPTHSATLARQAQDYFIEGSSHAEKMGWVVMQHECAEGMALLLERFPACTQPNEDEADEADNARGFESE